MEKLKYFFECYFNQSVDYADIENLVKEYKEIESVNYVETIISELNAFHNNKNWNEFSSLAYKAGGRLIAIENCEEFVSNIYQLFQNS